MTRDRWHSGVGTAFLALFAFSSLLLLSACAQLERLGSQPAEPEVVETAPPEPSPPPEPPAPKRNALYQWYGDGRAVSRIEIDVDEQKAVFYDGPYQIGWTRVASGIRSYPTPTGTFAITEKVADKRSNLYGKILNNKGKVVRKNAEMGVHRIPAGGRFQGAKMPYFMRLTNDGIGMHAGPIPRPGRPASHGCIRMPHAIAPVLYKHVAVGTPVSIVGSGPSYGKYLASQRRKKPEGAPAPKTEGTKTQVAATSPAEAAQETESVSATTEASTTANVASAQTETIAPEATGGTPPTAASAQEASPGTAATAVSQPGTTTPPTTPVGTAAASGEPALTTATATAVDPEPPVAAASGLEPAGQPPARTNIAENPSSSETTATPPAIGRAGIPASPAPASASVASPSVAAEPPPVELPADATDSSSSESSADAAPANAPAAETREQG